MAELDRPQLTIANSACALHTCWVSKATETLRIYNIIAFHGNIGYANASLFYDIRTFPVLFGLVIVYVSPLF